MKEQLSGAIKEAGKIFQYLIDEEGLIHLIICLKIPEFSVSLRHSIDRPSTTPERALC